MTELRLRPAQVEILKYRGGKMAVSAVPGSGKTFVLSQLAAQIIAQGLIEVNRGQQVLIVTYLNSSVDTFKARIRTRLQEMGLPPTGYDVRTLHSLSLEIVRTALSGDTANMPTVMDEGRGYYMLGRAVDRWKDDNPDLWTRFEPEGGPQIHVRWRETVEKAAREYISTAKNERYRPDRIWARLQTPPSTEIDWSFINLLNGIYERYQAMLLRQNEMDYDDQVWLAVDKLEADYGLAQKLRLRWPFVLEDEAQDSVPLQEELLSLLTGEEGNLVRVGDPNQAITSTFTAAHPRFFNAFIDRTDVVTLPLPNSGRCAPRIIGAANALVNWVCDHHPVPEVRLHTFRRQMIEPAPPGDAQPNPLDSESNLVVKLYRHREEEEIPAVVQLAQRYLQKFPTRTAAILVPTNVVGFDVAAYLDARDVVYDTLLQGNLREREVAGALRALLSLLAEPLNTRTLKEAYAALHELGHPAAAEPVSDRRRFEILLGSIHRPEAFLFPQTRDDIETALPAHTASAEEIDHLVRFSAFVRALFDLRALPVDDLTLALGDELFAHGADTAREGDLAIAYQIAILLRSWRDRQPEWRLPDLVAQLTDVAEGRRTLNMSSGSDVGFDPKAGRITLSTQHKAKGMEWDAVFLISVDGYWIPTDLDAYFQGVYGFFGGDPTAEAEAQLIYLMEGKMGDYPDRSPTDAAHIDVISERLRLLYVGVTRARRFLQISRSRVARTYNKERENIPATAIGIIYQFTQQYAESN